MAQKKTTTKPAAKTSRRRARKRGWRVAVTVVGIALLAAGGYLWHQHQRAQDGEQLTRVAAVERRLDAAEQSLFEQLDRVRADADQRRVAVDARADETADGLAALSERVAALRDEFGSGVDQWRLFDAERLLIIADRHLDLAGDGDRAAAALRLAGEQLARLPDPALAPVREQIARDLAAVVAAPTVDVAGVLAELTALSRGVDGLPLAGDVGVAVTAVTAAADAADTAADAAADGADDADAADSPLVTAGKNFLADLKALVQIETDAPPILTAELRHLTREKLKLILQSCQLAFLRADPAVFTARTTAAAELVSANFDTDAAAVADWLARLQTLSAVSPRAPTPDIKASLDALHDATR